MSQHRDDLHLIRSVLIAQRREFTGKIAEKIRATPDVGKMGRLVDSLDFIRENQDAVELIDRVILEETMRPS